MESENDNSAVEPSAGEKSNPPEVKKPGWLKTRFFSLKKRASEMAEDSYDYLGVDKGMEWVKSQASSASESAASSKDKVLSYYNEAEFKKTYGPYLEKAVLTVATEVASEALRV